MDDVAEKLSRYVSAVCLEDLSSQALESAKKSSLETIGVMLAGSSAPGIDVIAGLAMGWGGKEEAHLSPTTQREPRALLRPKQSHLPCPVIPAVNQVDEHKEM